MKMEEVTVKNSSQAYRPSACSDASAVNGRRPVPFLGFDQLSDAVALSTSIYSLVLVSDFWTLLTGVLAEDSFEVSIRHVGPTQTVSEDFCESTSNSPQSHTLMWKSGPRLPCKVHQLQGNSWDYDAQQDISEA